MAEPDAGRGPVARSVGTAMRHRMQHRADARRIDRLRRFQMIDARDAAHTPGPSPVFNARSALPFPPPPPDPKSPIPPPPPPPLSLHSIQLGIPSFWAFFFLFFFF